MIRIGVTQRVEVVESYGERRDCLDQRWAFLLEGLDMFAAPLPNSWPDPQIALENMGLSGFILTGGNDLAELVGAKQPAAERDKTERAVLDYAAQKQLPVLGVCRGMQMINNYCGGSIWKVEGHAAVRHPVNPENGLSSLEDYIEVNSYHNRGLYPETLGEGLKPAVFGPDGSVEALYHQTLPWVGIMWHPEREEPFRDQDKNLLKSLFAVQKGA